VTDLITQDNYLEDEVSASLRLTKRTLRLWRQKRVGPPWAQPTRNLIIYPKRAFQQWLEAETVLPVNGGRGVK
jgi:hypothetical protein